MKVNPRLIILLIVTLAVGAVFAIPYLNNDPARYTEPGQNGQPGEGSAVGTFKTTPNPDASLKQALKDNRPVFLEFYAVT